MLSVKSLRNVFLFEMKNNKILLKHMTCVAMVTYSLFSHWLACSQWWCLLSSNTRFTAVWTMTFICIYVDTPANKRRGSCNHGFQIAAITSKRFHRQTTDYATACFQPCGRYRIVWTMLVDNLKIPKQSLFRAHLFHKDKQNFSQTLKWIRIY